MQQKPQDRNCLLSKGTEHCQRRGVATVWQDQKLCVELPPLSDYDYQGTIGNVIHFRMPRRVHSAIRLRHFLLTWDTPAYPCQPDNVYAAGEWGRFSACRNRVALDQNASPVLNLKAATIQRWQTTCYLRLATCSLWLERNFHGASSLGRGFSVFPLCRFAWHGRTFVLFLLMVDSDIEQDPDVREAPVT